MGVFEGQAYFNVLWIMKIDELGIETFLSEKKWWGIEID